MANPQFHGFLGYGVLKKTAGQATPAVGTQVSFPIASINPRNPNNLGYPSVVNVAGAPSVKVAGKKTPSVMLQNIPVKASWFILNNVADWIGAATSFLDTNNNSSEFAVGIHNGTSLYAVYDGMKFAQISLYQTAIGGSILMDAALIGQYGDSEKGTPTTFSAVSTDAGTLRDVTNVDFNSTATDVYNWRLTMMRPQGLQPTCDGTLYVATVESGMIGGSYRLVQNANAATTPSTTVTMKIGAGGAGIQFVLALSKDERQIDIVPSLLSATYDYTLFDATGVYPTVLTAM